MLAPSRVAAAMPTVGLVLKRGAPGAREVARRVIVRLAERGLRVVAESEEAAALGCDPVVDKAAMFEIASIIVVLGGDGTFLATARLTASLAAAPKPPKVSAAIGTNTIPLLSTSSAAPSTL